MEHTTNDTAPATTPGDALRRRFGRRAAVVATGSILALGAGGIAYAATTDAAPAPSASTAEDGSTTSPDGSTTTPDEGATAPDGSTVPPQGRRRSGGASGELCDDAPTDASPDPGTGGESGSSDESAATTSSFQAA